MERDEYLKMVAKQEKKAKQLLRQVVSAHPETPWAGRAASEERNGFGFTVYDRNWDPRGVRAGIQGKLPKL